MTKKLQSYIHFLGFKKGDKGLYFLGNEDILNELPGWDIQPIDSLSIDPALIIFNPFENEPTLGAYQDLIELHKPTILVNAQNTGPDTEKALKEFDYSINKKEDFWIARNIHVKLNDGLTPIDHEKFPMLDWLHIENGILKKKNTDINFNVNEAGGVRRNCKVCGKPKFSHFPDSLYLDLEPIDYCFTVSFNVIYKKNNRRIILSTMGPFPDLNLKWISYIKPSDFIIFQDYGWEYGMSVSIYEDIRRTCPYPDNLYFLTNDEITHQTRIKAGLNSFLVHHNSWLNEHAFEVSDSKKEFDAVLNSRISMSGYKRLHLARKVDNLAVIASRDNFNIVPDEISGHKYVSDHLLNLEEVKSIYRRSNVGLMLSGIEGGCFSSSEYLLSGLPVLSTPSLGGRDFFYNEFNSSICQPDVDSIKETVEQYLSKNINRHDIRNAHIELQRKQREFFFKEVLGAILEKGSINITPSLFFKEYFKPKSFVQLWPALKFRPFCSLRKGLDMRDDRVRFSKFRNIYIDIASKYYS